MQPKRVRTPIVWEAEWEGPIQNWARKFISKNLWRCDPTQDADDLLQEAYLTFHRVKATYPRVIEPAHFMALFKTAMNNQMHDRASAVKRKRETIVEFDPDVLAERISDLGNAGYISALLGDAPPSLRQAFHYLSENPEAVQWLSKHNKKLNLNAKLRRLLGIRGKGFDFVGGMRALLS